MRTVENLITTIRQITEATDITDTNTGIDDEQFIQFLNDAQDSMEASISDVYPDIFMVEKVIPTIINSVEYAIPDDAYLTLRVEKVEYSQNLDPENFFQLRQRRLSERITGVTGDPSFYMRRGSTILVNPIPTEPNGRLRVTYQKKVPRLDKTRGTVKAVTLNNTARTITSLTLDPTVLLDKDTLIAECFMTVVNKLGEVQMRRIEIDDIDENTGSVTVGSSFVFNEGETISVGDKVCAGLECTNRSQMPDSVERYLVSYSKFEIFKKDSSVDSAEAASTLSAIKSEIVSAYSMPDTDIDYVPQPYN